MADMIIHLIEETPRVVVCRKGLLIISAAACDHIQQWHINIQEEDRRLIMSSNRINFQRRVSTWEAKEGTPIWACSKCKVFHPRSIVSAASARNPNVSRSTVSASAMVSSAPVIANARIAAISPRAIAPAIPKAQRVKPPSSTPWLHLPTNL